MRHQRQLWLFVVAISFGGLLAAAAESAAAQEILNAQELETFAERYYQRPQPERVDSAIAFLGTTDLLANRSVEHMYFGFFANVFARHPERAVEWRELISKQNAQTRETLLKAMSASTELRQAIANEPPTPGRNDLCWGAFFATGDTRQVAPVIDALRFVGERRNEVLFAAAGSAKWSLALQARKHPLVRRMIEYIAANYPPPLRNEIADVLAKDASRIRQDVAAIMRSQQARGLWLEHGAAPTPNAKLSFLLGLPEKTAMPDAATSTGATNVLARAIEKARNAESYCSQYVVRDFALTQLKDHDFAAYGARIDYTAPDRYHVTQQAWLDTGSKYVFDEWVSVGDDNFQNSGLWFRTRDGVNGAQNRKLSLRELVQKLARIGVPRGIGEVTVGTRNYLQYTFEALLRRGEEGERLFCGPLASGDCELRLWIDAKSETLAKAHLSLRGRGKGGKSVHVVVSQVFDCHGEAINITPPPRLNAVDAPDEKFMVTDANVAAMPHHGGETFWNLGSSADIDRAIGLAVAHKLPTGNPLPRPPYPYMHYFRTEVQNVSDRSLKIVWFGSFTLHDGKWVGNRLAGTGPLARRFSSWYTDGERTENGVIPPGKTAVDSMSWTGSNAPGFTRQKWSYVAVDAVGNAYYAEAVVEPDVVKSVPPATASK